MPVNCMVFRIPCELTRSGPFYGVTPQKWPTTFVRDEEESRAISRDVCVDHSILLSNYLSNHMHLITNGFKHFQRPTRPIQGNVFL